MRRVATVLGSVAAAGALALGLAGSATAATGTLTINDKTYNDPGGCYPSDSWPMRIINRTNEVVFIFEGSNCTGGPLQAVTPGSGAISDFGGSVYIP